MLNTAGQTLSWVLLFDDENSITEFLNRSLKRFEECPDAKQPFVTERYARFPSARLEDFKVEANPTPVAECHPVGKGCPAQSRSAQGSVIARVFGRALDPDGSLSSETVKQEHYAQDRFNITTVMQEAIAQAIADAGAPRVPIPDELARLCVMHAYLGQTDVRPLSNPLGGKTELKQCEFWAQKVGDGDMPALMRVEGKSDVVVESPDGGRGFRHEIQLTWDGFIEMQESRMTRLLLSARGTEKLKWGGEGLKARAKSEGAVAHLVAGHPIDLACGVRYGIIGEPVADSEATTVPDAPRVASSEPPAQEPARQLMEALGPQFAIFLSVVQDDLNLSDQQKQMLQQMKAGAAEGLQQFMQQIQNAPDDERGKLQQQFREQANKQVTEVLAQLLQPEQQKRLRQIVLQQQRLFALADPEVAKELGFGNEQEKRFLMRIMEETQKRLQEFQQKAQEKIQQTAQATGNPDEVQKEAAKLQREAAKIRKEQEAKIEALLSDAQKEQWKAMLGKPLALEPVHPEKK